MSDDQAWCFSYSAKPAITIDVQWLTVENLPDVLALERRSNILPWSEANFRSSLVSSHKCLGFYIQERLVGYAIFSRVLDEAELLLLVVDKPFWGRGIASGFLLELIEQSGLAVRSIFLEVRESNAQAIALYETVGFNEIGRRNNYYPPTEGRGAGEDALIYALELI